MVATLGMQITPTKFEMLLNKNIDKLKNEGIFISEHRTGIGRFYQATFIDPMSNIEEND